MALMGVSPGPESAQDAGYWAALVARIADGDEVALARLYDSMNRLVYGMALRIVREPSAAEDVTLEVFLQVWRTAAKYASSRGTVASWLATLARSRSIDWLRSPQARFVQQSNPLEEVAGLSDGAPDPEYSSIEAGRTRVIRRTMQTLPPEQRQTIELALFSGLSHSEIAGRLGLPLGTVKARIRLGMSRLRESLVGYAEGIA